MAAATGSTAIGAATAGEAAHGTVIRWNYKTYYANAIHIELSIDLLSNYILQYTLETSNNHVVLICPGRDY
jgi:hypothetical protein